MRDIPLGNLVRAIPILAGRLLPRICLLCDASPAPANLCRACAQDLPVATLACPRCAIPVALPGMCLACRSKPPPFAEALAGLLYEPPVVQLVHQLKFGGVLAAAPVLGDRLLSRVAARRRNLVQVLVPMPLHRARLRERGFNQASEIAAPLHRALGLPLAHGAVVRALATSPQAGQPTLAARRRNIRGAFAVRDPAALRGRRIAIVDDVLTSGSTAGELARVLLGAGACAVEVWIAARAP